LLKETTGDFDWALTTTDIHPPIRSQSHYPILPHINS